MAKERKLGKLPRTTTFAKSKENKICRDKESKKTTYHSRPVTGPIMCVNSGSGVMSGTGSDLKVFSKIRLERAK